MSRIDVKNVSPDIMLPQIVLIVLVLGLTLFGCVMVYSASVPSALSESGDATSYLFDQVRFAAIGVIAAVVIWRFIPVSAWKGWLVWAAWFVSLVLIILTAFFGTSAYGAQRWLVLGPISFQPSEFVKIAIIIMMARIMSDVRAGGLDSNAFWLQVIILIGVPVIGLFATQSDLGTTAIILVGIIAILWLGDVPVRTMILIFAVLAVLAVLAIVLSSYRSSRFLFINPWNDGENGYGNGYQIIHSYYAFSEGGIFGVGLGNSREKFAYLPESETDFIFAIIGEELGMIGALVVVIAFLVLLWAGLQVARSAFDDFGAMVAGGLIVMLVFQAFLNIACVIGIFPTTGKPLPFISSGGSSIIASFMMVGVILSIASEAGSPSVYERRRENLRVVRATNPGEGARSGASGASRGSASSRRTGASSRSSQRYRR